MTQTTGRFFDEIGRLVTDAAGAAQGLRKEIETVVRGQAERVLRDLDIVQREEFEAIREMARNAREENERLARRVSELETEIRALKEKSAPQRPRRPIRRRKVKRNS